VHRRVMQQREQLRRLSAELCLGAHRMEKGQTITPTTANLLLKSLTGNIDIKIHTVQRFIQ